MALHQVVNSCAKQISLNTRVRPINYRKKVQARIKNVEWPLTATAADHHNLVCDQCVYSSCNRSTKHKIEIAVPANLVVYDCVEVLAYKRVQSDINKRQFLLLVVVCAVYSVDRVIVKLPEHIRLLRQIVNELQLQARVNFLYSPKLKRVSQQNDSTWVGCLLR